MHSFVLSWVSHLGEASLHVEEQLCGEAQVRWEHEL
jgi:hypothetical protein